MTLLVEVTARLRSGLGEQAGIALVLPDPTSLAGSLGVPDATAWASRVLSEIIRSVGSAEPELVLFAGPEARVRPGIAGVCEFFGAQAVHLAAGGPGTVVLAATPSGAEPVLPDEPIWLVTTAAEIPDTVEPACLGHTLGELRRTLTG
jgi:hypothetical protein